MNISMPIDLSFDTLSNKDKIKIATRFLEKFEIEFLKFLTPYIGSDFKPKKFSEIFGEPKTKIVVEDDTSKRVSDALAMQDWYVLDKFIGTSEEKSFIEFISTFIANMKKQYKEIYLLRNEEVYKMFDFSSGKGFQPDFLLFLKDVDNIYLQVFIEPKGAEYIGQDGSFITGKEGWKEQFLREISMRYSGRDVLKFENHDYRLVGLPFYNSLNKNEFQRSFLQILNLP